MDYLRKAAKHIVAFCISEEIGTVVVGVDKGQKQRANMGHVNNQTHSGSFGIFCKTFASGTIFTTVKASFLDKDLWSATPSIKENIALVAGELSVVYTELSMANL